MVPKSRILVLAWIVGVPCLATLACGSSDTPAAITGPVVDTTTLVGTWKGSVNGSYGYSTFTTLLKADSTMTGEAANLQYCKVAGTWTVTGGQYRAVGRDCDGVVITWIAPFAKRRLFGTWTASSGRSGTFDVAKEP